MRDSLVLRTFGVVGLACLGACNVTDPPKLDHVDVIVAPQMRTGDSLIADVFAVIGPSRSWPDPHPVSWSVDDSTIVHLEQLNAPESVIVRGVRPGTTLIHALVEDKVGSASVQVLP